MKTKEGFICCLCKKHSYGHGKRRQFGNNPAPLKQKGECCDDCNWIKVIPARIKLGQKY